MPSSRGSSWPRDWTQVSWVSCIADRFFSLWAMGKLTYTAPFFYFHLVSSSSFMFFTSFPFYFKTYFAVCISTSDPFSLASRGCICLMFEGCSTQFPEWKTELFDHKWRFSKFDFLTTHLLPCTRDKFQLYSLNGHWIDVLLCCLQF